MSSPFLTFKEAAKVIFQLTKLYPRSTATNIRSLVVDLIEKLANILLKQLANFGYIGMIGRADIDALTGVDAWAEYGDPGP